MFSIRNQFRVSCEIRWTGESIQFFFVYAFIQMESNIPTMLLNAMISKSFFHFFWKSF